MVTRHCRQMREHMLIVLVTKSNCWRQCGHVTRIVEIISLPIDPSIGIERVMSPSTHRVPGP